MCEIAREAVVIENIYPDLAKFPNDFCGVEFRELQYINLSDENASLMGRGALSRRADCNSLWPTSDSLLAEGVIYPRPIKESKDLFNAPGVDG